MNSNVKEWLNKARSNDPDNPRLNEIHRKNDHAFATDGFVLHMVEEKDGAPNIDNVMNDAQNANDKGIYVYINPENLINALRGMERCILHIADEDSPVEISGTVDGTKCYALIMPMRGGGVPHEKSSIANKCWRPEISK